MLNEMCIILATTLILTFISTQCCIYTAIMAFLILSSLGLSPIYCWGEVDGDDHYHVWVRVGSHNIETSTLNIYHSNMVDYEDPVATFNTTSEFVDRMDMLSPIRWSM